MIWRLYESAQAVKILARAPRQVVIKYQFWANMLQTQGPEAVRKFPGFRDEALKGEWGGYRASRLNIQYRVIYRIEEREITVYVEKIDPRTYRR